MSPVPAGVGIDCRLATAKNTEPIASCFEFRAVDDEHERSILIDASWPSSAQDIAAPTLPHQAPEATLTIRAAVNHLRVAPRLDHIDSARGIVRRVAITPHGGKSMATAIY